MAKTHVPEWKLTALLSARDYLVSLLTTDDLQLIIKPTLGDFLSQRDGPLRVDREEVQQTDINFNGLPKFLLDEMAASVLTMTAASRTPSLYKLGLTSNNDNIANTVRNLLKSLESQELVTSTRLRKEIADRRGVINTRLSALNRLKFGHNLQHSHNYSALGARYQNMPTKDRELLQEVFGPFVLVADVITEELRAGFSSATKTQIDTLNTILTENGDNILQLATDHMTQYKSAIDNIMRELGELLDAAVVRVNDGHTVRNMWDRLVVTNKIYNIANHMRAALHPESDEKIAVDAGFTKHYNDLAIDTAVSTKKARPMAAPASEFGITTPLTTTTTTATTTTSQTPTQQKNLKKKSPHAAAPIVEPSPEPPKQFDLEPEEEADFDRLNLDDLDFDQIQNEEPAAPRNWEEAAPPRRAVSKVSRSHNTANVEQLVDQIDSNPTTSDDQLGPRPVWLDKIIAKKTREAQEVISHVQPSRRRMREGMQRRGVRYGSSGAKSATQDSVVRWFNNRQSRLDWMEQRDEEDEDAERKKLIKMYDLVRRQLEFSEDSQTSLRSFCEKPSLSFDEAGAMYKVNRTNKRLDVIWNEIKRLMKAMTDRDLEASGMRHSALTKYDFCDLIYSMPGH